MGKKTKIFKRLPKDAGVTFEGFEDTRIKGREIVREQLEDFLEYCKTARGTALRVILGEWGEGKTDTYRRYIRPKCEAEGNLAFFVSASALSNSFDLSDIQKLFETTSLPAVRFLVALFSSIKQEQKENLRQNLRLIPSPKGYDNAEAYLDKIFRNLIGRKTSRRIFVFIDEFEELLLYVGKLKQIISGIKETINGQYSNIDEGGKYEGGLHLVIAATPDAYYRLQVSEETALIFGGLGRRGAVIDLPQIRKGEGMGFLFALLNYSYRNDLPEPLPFKTSGIFNAIFRITQGNPGNIVSLFTRLMNSAKADRHYIKVIDYEHFLKFLEKQQVFVYGGTSPCLEQETFLRMLKTVEDQKTSYLGKACGKVLKILTGELRPFLTFGLSKRIDCSEKEVKRFIAIINGDLKAREKIDRAVLKLGPLKNNKSLADVKNAFNEYITMEREKKWIRIDNYSESLEDFEDRITYFDIIEGKIVAKIYLPPDNYSVSSFFEGISPDKAVELAHFIRRRLCADEDYYLVSDEFLSQVYPTPIPRELEFIRNRDVRWKLWRELRKNLVEQYGAHMPSAFVDMLEASDLFDVSPVKKLPPNASINRIKVDDLDINMLFNAINGDVKSTDIEEISKCIRRTRPPIHCCVVLYTGEVTPKAQDKITDKELGKEGENVIVEIKIHPTLARRLICTQRARSEYPKEVDTRLFDSVIRKVVTQDIDFGGKIRNWLSTQVQRGVMVKDLEVDATSNLREFADSLKFYINFIEKRATPKEIFEKNRKELLDTFIKYGSKVGLIPDIELPQFLDLTKDLLINGFLSRKENKYNVQLHPVEKRILRILEKETKLSEKELVGFFIVRSPRVLKDVFLSILDYKGVIRQEANYFLLNESRKLFQDVELEYQRFKRQIEAKKDLWKYGYILLWKKRKEHRFITLREFVEYADAIYQESKGCLYEADKSKVLQKLSLLRNLLGHFNKHFLPSFSSATDQAKRTLIETEIACSEFEGKLTDIKDGCNKWLKLEFEVKSIKEHRDITQLLQAIKEVASYEYDEVEKQIGTLREDDLKKFYFRHSEEDAFYFNPKLYKIEQLKIGLNEALGRSNPIIREIDQIFKDLDEKLSDVEYLFRTAALEKKFKVSTEILRVIKVLLKDLLPEVKSMLYESVTLRQIRERMKENKESILSTMANLEKCIRQLQEMVENEKAFLVTLSDSQELAEHVKKIFDINNYKKPVGDLNGKMKEIKEAYGKTRKVIALKNAEKLLIQIGGVRNTLSGLEEDLRDKMGDIDRAWNTYVTEAREFIESLSSLLVLTKTKYKIPYKLIEKKLADFEEIIGIKDVRKINSKLSKLEEIKEDIHKRFYKSIQPFLKRREIDLLQLIIDEIKTEKRAWLSQRELCDIAEKKLKIKPNDTEKVIDMLMKEGLLKAGVSLAF